MPIQLTTPFTFSPGHGKPAEMYAQVKIVEFVCAIEEKSLRMRVQYGNTVGGVWQPGKADQALFIAADAPAQLLNGEQIPATSDYTALVVASLAKAADVVAAGAQGYNCYVATARELYEWLIEQGHYEGTVV